MTDNPGKGSGSFFSSLNNWITGSATGQNSGDQTKSFDYSWEKHQNLRKAVMQLDLCSARVKNKVMSKAAGCSGVLSVSLDSGKMTVVGDQNMDIVGISMKLRKHCHAVIVSFQDINKVKTEKERANKQPTKEDQNTVLIGKLFDSKALSGGPGSRTADTPGADGYITTAVNTSTQSDDCLSVIASVQDRNKVKTEKEIANKQPMKEDQITVLEGTLIDTEALSGGPGSRTADTPGSDGYVTTAVNTRTQSDWYSFCQFLNNRLRPLTLSGCSGQDAIDFLRKGKTSSDPNVLVGRLSAACEAYGIKPKDNPFRSLAVITYLKEAREVTPETECILFVSSDHNLDVEETSFNKAILKELNERKVTPLTYNISGGENLDADMLYRSSVGIMVLSNSSSACSSQSLDQLVAIMEHCKAKDLVIIPVYFKVTLSDICGLECRFGADRVQKWKVAMNEMASMDGHQWSKGTQFMLAKKVVRNACLRLYLKSSKNLVRILALLNHPQPPDAEFEGIWGMAGIGKTSIAREIFEVLAPQYDFCYFLQDFHLMCQSKGLRQIRNDFFSKLFREEKLSISACDTKPSFMRDWFHNKAILVVLDDVSNTRDAEYVVGGFGWFSHGHRIILTSRKKQVLLQCKVKEPYEIQKLCAFESFRLCKQYITDESEVISELMSCSSGIPLALKVLVSSVSKRHINNMKEHLQSLQKNPPTKIQKAFQRSFDGLDENEKNIFLDIACFFGGENKDHVVQLLDACGFLTYLGICELIYESLISLLDNKIEIPIPFQDMGRFIVHEEDEDPCERSRLWDSIDIVDVLTNNSGTEAIEGIFLDASDLTCDLSPTVFGNMYRLRLLKFYCSTSGNESKLNLPQGLDSLPDELRLLHWENYPLDCWPRKFNPENLVEVNMPYSNMKKLWAGKKNLGKLKKIKLCHSTNLTDIVMLSEALSVEHIDLEGCTSLVDVSTSIPRCGKLVSLNMKDCSHLRTLPSMVHLTSLKILNLSGCFQLEEIQDFAPNLKELYLAGTPIRELPLSIENITELVTLDLENCRRLQKLPFWISNSRSIVELKLSGCTSLESLPNFAEKMVEDPHYGLEKANAPRDSDAVDLPAIRRASLHRYLERRKDRLFKTKKAPGVASSSLEMHLNRQPLMNAAACSQNLSGGTGGEHHVLSESPEN